MGARDQQSAGLALASQLEERTKKRRRVGILGGSFNPIHQGHLIIADQVYDKLCLDQVYLMPNYQAPHVDPKAFLDADKRLAMLELAIAGNEHLAIEKLELERKGKSYSFDTMDILTKLNPDTDYYFIIGADMVEYLPTWYRIDDLVETVQFVGVKRPGYQLETDYPVLYVDVPEMAISSTQIRQAVSQGHSIRYLVPEAVRHYIEEEGLYLDA
ncbi:nicotinate-nucleotide adenylyltransferase [Aerococcus sanguinicola]|uniref:Probable nicotinate-nucleotide adenylyltransferase n=1 Tax=Aerococcus sanguinicola TaxID=119206 RepID=A0A0X8FA10_9LACT|nr:MULTISPECIES: nicotinate-nucleotide adenylyltransferase [Aerococcus]AMB93513.1 nicotinate-nicotinamide nucleotide adenylyltransferase [Aerococcus sanguinicola]MDK7050731.1 nicotinate-nucleotide adenylyltransferase [Aerococcus sanguinicola]OFT97555.1 nicotinic acid mononucleotide adenylyltransferase [Aerococcus sp. HMSC23C02]PKZ21758.1 nicotinate-nucleotide adenylyltransferase [Aerococcus sanguinicola]